MTNEEHIEQLKKLRSFHNGSYGRSINKAIKALEQEPKYCDHNICVSNEYNGIGCDECEVKAEQEQSTDAVSRQVLIEELTNIAKMKAKSDAQKALIGRCIYFIEHLPPVTPTRPKGHWIHPYEYGLALPEHYCSECKAYEYSDVKSKYCPNCGADMREGEV